MSLSQTDPDLQRHAKAICWRANCEGLCQISGWHACFVALELARLQVAWIKENMPSAEFPQKQ